MWFLIVMHDNDEMLWNIHAGAYLLSACLNRPVCSVDLVSVVHYGYYHLYCHIFFTSSCECLDDSGYLPPLSLHLPRNWSPSVLFGAASSFVSFLFSTGMCLVPTAFSLCKLFLYFLCCFSILNILLLLFCVSFSLLTW